MAAEADIPLEIPIAMPARLYAPARARWYRETGAARDDEALPPFVPEGALLARKLSRVDRVMYSGWIDTGGIYRFEAPAEDVALDPTAFVETSEPPGQVVQDPAPVVVLRRGQAPPPRPPARFVPDPARCVALVTTPALERVPAPQIVANGAWKPRVEFYPAPVREELVGLLAVEVPQSRHGRYLVRRDGGPVLAGAVPPSNQVYVWTPPLVRGAYGRMEQAELKALDAPELALVPDPHPFLDAEALPAGEGPDVVVATSYDYTTIEFRRFRRVRTQVLIVPTAKRHSARRREEGWIGHHREAPSGNLLGKVIDALPGEFESGIRTLARSAAVQLVLTVATYGAAAAATSALAQAAEVGAAGAAGSASSTAPGAVARTETAGAVSSSSSSAAATPARAVEAASTAAPLAAKVAPVVAPKVTNAALAEAAKGSAYLAGLDEFYGIVLRELVVQAQLTQRDRDALRLELALIKAKVAEEGGQTLAIAVTVWRAVRAIVLTVATGGAAEGAARAVEEAAMQALSAAQKAVELLTTALRANDERELLRIVEEKIRAMDAAAIAELEALLNAPALAHDNAAALSGPSEATPAGPAPSSAPEAAAATPEGAPARPVSRFVAVLIEWGDAIGRALERIGERPRTSTVNGGT